MLYFKCIFEGVRRNICVRKFEVCNKRAPQNLGQNTLKSLFMQWFLWCYFFSLRKQNYAYFMSDKYSDFSWLDIMNSVSHYCGEPKNDLEVVRSSFLVQSTKCCSTCYCCMQAAAVCYYQAALAKDVCGDHLLFNDSQLASSFPRMLKLSSKFAAKNPLNGP